MKIENDVHNNVFHYNTKGQLHKEDGPAAVWANGEKEWFNNGKCHRLDGPAVEWFNTYDPPYQLIKEWWIKGRVYQKPQHNRFALFYVLEPLRIELIPT